MPPFFITLFLLVTACTSSSSSDTPTYNGFLTSEKIDWNGRYPPSIGPTHKNAMTALKTILLSTYEHHQKQQAQAHGDHGGDHHEDPRTTDQHHHRPSKIDQEDLNDCGPSAPTVWQPDRLRLTQKRFKDMYIFHGQIGDLFIGTDHIDLLGFDGMINLQVVGTTMSLIVHSSCKNKTPEECRSDVEERNRQMTTEERELHECTDVNMLVLQLKVTKLGIAHPNLNTDSLPFVVRAVADFSDGLHLSDLPLKLSNLLPSTHEYELQVRLGLSASATFDVGTHRWQMTKEDVHLCSPGIELQGEIAEGSVVSWLVSLVKGIVADTTLVPMFCAIKYTIPNVPWLGHVLSFVATEEARKKNEAPVAGGDAGGGDIFMDSNQVFEDEEESIFQLSFDNLITPAAPAASFETLDFRTGVQLNVPTLPFVSHLLDASKEIATDLDTDETDGHGQQERDESLGEGNAAPLSKKDQALLMNLKSLGFNQEVFESIQIIQLYLDKMTRNTAEISKWLTAVMDNIWNVLFTGGNDVEMLFKGGLGIKKDKLNKNGGLYGTIDHFKIEALAKKTPIDVRLFFMEKLQLQLLQGVSHLCVPFLFSFC